MIDSSISPVEKIKICLSLNEWDLLITETFIDNDLTASVVTDGKNKQISWSVDDIEDVIGYIAEAANHVKNKLIVKKLIKLLDKIENSSKIQPDDYVPDWAQDGAKLRTAPYTEEELDVLTEGAIGSIDDLGIWKNLVATVGLDAAKQTIRRSLQKQQNPKPAYKPGH